MQTNMISRLITSFIFIAGISTAQVTVVPASGGSGLSTSSYTTLGDIVIYENMASDIPSQGDGHLVLKLPKGYVFDLGSLLSYTYSTRPAPNYYYNVFDVFGSFPANDTILDIGLEYTGTMDVLGDTITIKGLSQ